MHQMLHFKKYIYGNSPPIGRHSDGHFFLESADRTNWPSPVIKLTL